MSPSHTHDHRSSNSNQRDTVTFQPSIVGTGVMIAILAANSCNLIVDEIKLGCAMLTTDAPLFCRKLPRCVRGHAGARWRRSDCMMQFKEAWERFADDEANPVEFLNVKRKRH
jgi:hypothetical protein